MFQEPSNLGDYDDDEDPFPELWQHP